MPKPAKEYSVLETEDLKKALGMIAFPVIRVPLFCEIEGKRIELPKEAIFRKDTLSYFETLSPDYSVIKHENAFEAMVEALKPFGATLKAVAIDQAGAKMSARFQINKTYEIAQGVQNDSGADTIKPEITLVNSYNTATALGLHLGSFRPIGLNVALVSGDFRSRWMHLGNKADPVELREAIQAALQDFEQRIVLLYRKMADQPVTKLQAIEAVILAVKKNVIPAKLGKYALHCVASDSALAREKGLPRSMWTLFNAFTWATSHAFRGTPTRAMEIQLKIARYFKDGGQDILKQGSVKPEEVERWLQKSVGLVAA